MPVGEMRIYEVNGWYTDDPRSPDLRTPPRLRDRARQYFLNTLKLTGMITPWLGLGLILLSLKGGPNAWLAGASGALLFGFTLFSFAYFVRGSGYALRATVRGFDQVHPAAKSQLTGEFTRSRAVEGRAICPRWLVEALVDTQRPTEVLLAFVPGTKMQNVVGLKPTRAVPAGVIRAGTELPEFVSAVVPIDGACADHPETVSTASCARCGRFICSRCDENLAEQSQGHCLACWVLLHKQPSRAGYGNQATQLSIAISALIYLLSFGLFLVDAAGGNVEPFGSIKITVAVALLGLIAPFIVILALRRRPLAVLRASTPAAAPSARTP